MKRIDRIERFLRDHGKDNQITATELADRLGFSRANTSGDLNRLCEEGRAVKRGTKPVYYSTAAASPALSGFDLFLQKNGSLHQSGELAKAAVLYPPQGMHIMLLGETGAGKSMFAELIYDFALSQGRITGGAFVSFNCADYANNPQLLISQLFGVTKGAYTGADSDKAGLLEQANGGILFLDEVHRLPPEGQEMLFTYIDRGCYRRLGETRSTRTAAVMLICATTENPESSLLKTFIRRIPMLIKIPGLEERSIEERLTLISNFFSAESLKLRSPIMVSVNSIRALLGYTCGGNIGQLKSDIQLLCARSYSDFISKRKDSINITSYNLPPAVRNGLFTEKNRKKIWNIFAGINSRFISFDPLREDVPLGDRKNDGGDIYSIIERRTEEMHRVGASQEQIDEVIDHIMAEYYEQYSPETETEVRENIEWFVGAEVMATVEKMLSIAVVELGRTYSDNIRYGLCLHLKSAIQRVQQGLPIVNPRFGNIQREMPQVLEAAKRAVQTAEQDFNIKLPPDEAGFVALFFASEGTPMARHPVVQVIVVAHGKGIATGMAETANRLLGINIIRGFDMAFDENPLAVYTRIREYLEQRGDAVDVLLLVDMGSLVNYAGDLERELKIRIKCISLVSTLHVLEAGRKTLLGYSLYDVYEDTRRIGMGFLDEDHSLPKQPIQRLYLLSICTTGEGSAHLLQDYLSEKLDLKGICKIISLQLADHQGLDEKVTHLKASGRIIGVISAFSTNIPAAHYKISASMTPQGIARIQRRIDTEAVFAQVEDNLFKTLVSLQGSTAIGEIRSMLERIERALGVELSGEMLVGVFCHIGCMLDRLKHGEPVGIFPDKRSLRGKYPGETRLIEQECRHLSELYGVEIPQDEVCYILVFFTKESLF